MAVKTIETRAVISAQDRTGAIFAQVARNLRGLESTAAGVSRRLDGVARGMSAVGLARQRHEDIARRMSSNFGAVAATAGFVGATASMRQRAIESAALAGAKMGAAAVIASPIVRRVIIENAARAHENLRMETSGMSAAEIADSQRQMSILGRRYPSIGNTMVGSVIRGGRTIVGDYQSSVDIADPLLRFAVVLKHVNKKLDDAALEEQMDQFIRAADLTGMTKNVKMLRNFTSGIGQAALVFGERVTPAAYLNAAQSAGAAATMWSQDFISGPLTSMIQTMGGDRTGTSLGTLFQATIGGKMKPAAAQNLMKLGLLDPKKVKFNKTTGEVSKIYPGAIRGSDLLLENSFEWSKQYFQAALDKKGITDPKKITEVIAGSFSDKRAGAAIAFYINQRANIERDIALRKRGMQFDQAVPAIQAKDPDVVWEGVSKSSRELERALGQDVTPKIVQYGVRLSDGLQRFSQALDRSPVLRGGTWGAGALTAWAAGHIGMGVLGGYFGGAGGAAALGGVLTAGATAAPFIGTAALLGYAYQHAQDEKARKAEEGRAAFARMRHFQGLTWLDEMRNQALLANYGSSAAVSAGYVSGFGIGRAGKGFGNGWSAGDAASSVAPGALAFGLGGASSKDAVRGIGDTKALRLPPPNVAAEERARTADIAAALRTAPAPTVRLEGEASIVNKVEITPSAEFNARIDQQVNARGNLRADTGISMPAER